MMKKKCNFQIAKPKLNIQALIDAAIENALEGFPFSVALDSGTLLVTQTTYPEEVAPTEDLKANGAKTLVWKTDIYGVYDTVRLVFWADTQAGGGSLGDPLPEGTEVRVVIDPPGALGAVGSGTTGLAPGALLGSAVITTKDIHVLTLTKPVSDGILYVHFKYPGTEPIGLARTEIHGIRIDLLV